MKSIFTTAGISLLAWLAFAPFQAAQAHEHTSNSGETTVAQIIENGSPLQDGSSLDQSPNRVITDNEGDDPGVDNFETEGTGEPVGRPNVRQPQIDAQREIDDEGQSSLDQSPNRVINDNEGDDPGVDSFEVEGTGEGRGPVRQSENNPIREADREGQSSIDNSPNRVINDNEGDDPGVDDYEVEGTGEADRGVQRDTYTRETYINQPQVDSRPRYNRPVTGQTTQQQPTVDYNRPATQAPSNTQQNYSNEPVRGLW
ncbi:hypothetical protein [Leptolyngbya sp. FACHB-8]|uniref:hypothetical protein n=1 Tax=unclassified Leptolyngbya TaxID=2650499 RepID=UPI0016862FFA|nr:hypothetical protein [Leptolyngbya sp. FACHB-8]MBD1911158.1 hypothetical protein [Leptolyngbya sp. FACHB-8]